MDTKVEHPAQTRNTKGMKLNLLPEEKFSLATFGRELADSFRSHEKEDPSSKESERSMKCREADAPAETPSEEVVIRRGSGMKLNLLPPDRTSIAEKLWKESTFKWVIDGIGKLLKPNSK